jgi:hypothetical protein
MTAKVSIFVLMDSKHEMVYSIIEFTSYLLKQKKIYELEVNMIMDGQ